MGKQPLTSQWVEIFKGHNPAQARWERKEAERLREIKRKKQNRKRKKK